jgi:hypothetical protein
MAAYELVEIYCELIAARMPMIESQKYFQTPYFVFLFSLLYITCITCLYIEHQLIIWKMHTMLVSVVSAIGVCLNVSELLATST